mmetsp:Transcript_24483/g.56811  ORF Transcript_24483/g.56811 Transcript_24483/m.56811 type:complete len:619 (+) Transcript_24483:38-1894(+)
MTNEPTAKVVQPPEEVIRLDDNEEVPLHSRRELFDRQQSDSGKGKGRGRGKGKGKGKARGKNDGKQDKNKGPVPKSDKGLENRIKRYEREEVPKDDLKSKRDKRLTGQLKKSWRSDREAAFRLAKAEVLQTAEAGFIEAEDPAATARLKQQEIIDAAGVGIAKKHFSFDLPYGPYSCSMTRNGQNMLVGGAKGHVAFMHLDSMQFTELHLKETVRAVQALHNENMFAVAQRKYIYIYDKQGIELHCIKQQKSPGLLDFLPYHFLLVSAGERGDITWRDISTGEQVAEHRTHLGPTTCMRQNPKNAVMHLGHTKGLVTLWTPTVKEPVVKMACHNSKVSALAVHGNYMVTAGAESRWKVWDLRTYQELHSYRSIGHAVNSIDVSMTGLVATGAGCRVQAWKDVFAAARPTKPYITEEYKGRMVECVRFRPFEDVCCVGHTDGFASLIMPGAGKANFDSFEANPYENKQQRREREVNSLLDKLQPDSIMLDPNKIGQLNKNVVTAWKEEAAKKEAAEAAEAAKNKKQTKKMRGKNKVGNRMKRKALKQVSEQRQKAKERTQNTEDADDGDSDDEDDDDEDGVEDDAGQQTGDAPKPQGKAAPPGVGAALSRFYGKRRRKT